jgi:hypothetical protein
MVIMFKIGSRGEKGQRLQSPSATSPLTPAELGLAEGGFLNLTNAIATLPANVEVYLLET